MSQLFFDTLGFYFLITKRLLKIDHCLLFLRELNLAFLQLLITLLQQRINISFKILLAVLDILVLRFDSFDLIVLHEELFFWLNILISHNVGLDLHFGDHILIHLNLLPQFLEVFLIFSQQMLLIFQWQLWGDKIILDCFIFLH